jgi:hypothetical protein
MEEQAEFTRQPRHSFRVAHRVKEHMIANALIAPDYFREVG